MTTALILAWLRSNWRLVALGAFVAAVLGFVGLAMHWRNDAIHTHAQLVQSQKDLKACNERSAALTKQIKDTAVQEGHRYEKTEADHLASCRDAYNAGARKLRNDSEAIRAGRYVPGGSAGKAAR